MTELPGALVSGPWLVEHLDQVVVADVRWSIETGPQRRDYEEGHIPGAVFVDLDADLSAPPSTAGRHPLPTSEAFAEARSRLGLAGKPVVAYDDRGGAVASRLWWMLDAVGHPAAVLDGGIDSWTGRLETGTVASSGQPVEPIDWSGDRFIDADEIESAVVGGAVLIDARSTERFIGTPNDIDPRPGHIPGASSRPWTDNLDDDGSFKSSDRLRAELSDLGIEPPGELVASCGSGVTACHDLLAARLAGLGRDARLYVGSWSEWGADLDRPVETGDWRR